MKEVKEALQSFFNFCMVKKRFTNLLCLVATSDDDTSHGRLAAYHVDTGVCS